MIDWPSIALQMFAKCPANGCPKTRLQPPLTQVQASALHRQLATHTLQVLYAASGNAAQLWLDQPSEDPWLGYLKTILEYSVYVQCEGDLGKRMSHAICTGLHDHKWVILVGGDCPVLTVAHLHQVAQMLGDGCDAMFIPTEDGGYVLIGVRRHHDLLFSGIKWSTAHVMQQTRQRLQQLNWRWGELSPLWDVDTPCDLERLRRGESNLPVLSL